jgi:hypothetical protein
MKQVYMSLFVLLLASAMSVGAMESKGKVEMFKKGCKMGVAGIIGREVGQVAGYFICNEKDEETRKTCMGLLGASVGIVGEMVRAKRSSLNIEDDVSEKQS